MTKELLLTSMDARELCRALLGALAYSGCRAALGLCGLFRSLQGEQPLQFLGRIVDIAPQSRGLSLESRNIELQSVQGIVGRFWHTGGAVIIANWGDRQSVLQVTPRSLIRSRIQNLAEAANGSQSGSGSFF